MTLTEEVRVEEREARERQRRGQRAARAAAKAFESERWRAFKDYARGKGCRCDISRGMTHEKLVRVNLSGTRKERHNCAGDSFICPVLCKALDLTRGGGKL